MGYNIQKPDLIYPELSFELIGCAYEVYNHLGFGHLEKFYQRAFAIALEKKQIKIQEQVYHTLKFEDKVIGKMFFDFLIDNKVIVGLKKNNRFSRQHINQVNEYLKTSGLLINFTSTGVISKILENVQ